MEWLAENANNGYFLLAFAAVMLAGVWWIQRQIIYLIGSIVMLGALAGFWLFIRDVPTTQTKIEADLVALGKALIGGDKEAAVPFAVEDFKYKSKNRDKWSVTLTEWIDNYAIDAILVKDLEVKSRTGDEASVLFRLDARSKGTPIFSAECPWKLRREDDIWKVEKVIVRKPTLKADKDVPADE